MIHSHQEKKGNIKTTTFCILFSTTSSLSTDAARNPHTHTREDYISTSVKPKNERFGRRVLLSLEEPIEQCSPRFFVDSNIPRIVCKAHAEILTGKCRHFIQLLLINCV